VRKPGAAAMMSITGCHAPLLSLATHRVEKSIDVARRAAGSRVRTAIAEVRQHPATLHSDGAIAQVTRAIPAGA